MKNHHGMQIHTSLKSGDLYGDMCYFSRNSAVMSCALKGWPQNSYRTEHCVGNNIERELKNCLFTRSKEPNWYQAFPECTSNQQCYDNRPAYTAPTR